MILWRSNPLPRPPAWPLLAMGMVLWLAPFILGRGVLWVAAMVEGAVGNVLAGLASILFFSPLLAWVGWLIALPGAWLLMRAGRFGWVPVLALGSVAGAIAAVAVVITLPAEADRWPYLAAVLPLCTVYGALATLALRALSALVIPAAILPDTNAIARHKA